MRAPRWRALEPSCARTAILRAANAEGEIAALRFVEMRAPLRHQHIRLPRRQKAVSPKNRRLVFRVARALDRSLKVPPSGRPPPRAALPHETIAVMPPRELAIRFAGKAWAPGKIAVSQRHALSVAELLPSGSFERCAFRRHFNYYPIRVKACPLP
jgi:hypothetical protein